MDAYTMLSSGEKVGLDNGVNVEVDGEILEAATKGFINAVRMAVRIEDKDGEVQELSLDQTLSLMIQVIADAMHGEDDFVPPKMIQAALMACFKPSLMWHREGEDDIYQASLEASTLATAVDMRRGLRRALIIATNGDSERAEGLAASFSKTLHSEEAALDARGRIQDATRKIMLRIAKRGMQGE